METGLVKYADRCPKHMTVVVRVSLDTQVIGQPPFRFIRFFERSEEYPGDPKEDPIGALHAPYEPFPKREEGGVKMLRRILWSLRLQDSPFRFVCEVR